MPILMPNGEYKRRDELNKTPKNPKRHKKPTVLSTRTKPRKKGYKGAKVIKTVYRSPTKMTQEQATYIYDTQLARRLRNITRED